MHATLTARGTGPTHAALIDRGSVTFLTGQAWSHTDLAYRILTDATIGGLPLAVVRQAVTSWNDALAHASVPRLRDFRLVRAAPGRPADIVIHLVGADSAVHGATEIASDRDDAIVEAVVRLTWPPSASPDDLGVLGTYAVRGIGRALGIGHAADPADPMYPAFNGVKLRPSASDVVAFGAVEEWYVAGSPIFYPPRGYTFA
jgi:hypothetical protein